MKINRWSIFRANLDPVIGSEQGKTRPVLVISDDDINTLLNCVNVIPITSRKTAVGTYSLPNESIVLCHQIRTLDKRRLSLKYGDIADSPLQDEIIEALSFQLGL